ncbi:MAG TPA: hypothetical protein VGM63_08180 [Mucilaginibacter sp.]|jgi:uncharacterized peroxidase-related enzyme
MRLHQVEKGDSFFQALLIRFISIVSGMRLPDAARIVMYHQYFYGKPMTTWTQAAMRGESNWSVGERELFAAMTAKWNSCIFCINAHSAIASLVLDKTLVQAALEDFRQANLSPKLQTILAFLEILTKTPDEFTVAHVHTLLSNGITQQEAEDAMAVITLFGITVRLANALNFDIPGDSDFSRGASRMLEKGYVFGKSNLSGHPDHQALAEVLRKRVLEGPGITNTSLRQAMANRASGGPAVAEPAFDDLAREIGNAAYKVTDEQVEKVVQKAGSEKAVFELIVATAVGAGLYRWQKGLSVLKEAIGTDTSLK